MLNADEGVIDDSSVPSVSELSTMVPCHSADPLINTINSLLTAVLGNLKYRSAQCPQIESAIDTDQHLRELSATIISGIGRVSGSLLDHLREGDVRVPTLQTYFSDATNDPGAGIYLLSYGNSVDDQHQQPEIYAGSFGQEVATMPEGLPKRSAEPMVRRLLKAVTDRAASLLLQKTSRPTVCDTPTDCVGDARESNVDVTALARATRYLLHGFRRRR